MFGDNVYYDNPNIYHAYQNGKIVAHVSGSLFYVVQMNCDGGYKLIHENRLYYDKDACQNGWKPKGDVINIADDSSSASDETMQRRRKRRRSKSKLSRRKTRKYKRVKSFE